MGLGTRDEKRKGTDLDSRGPEAMVKKAEARRGPNARRQDNHSLMDGAELKQWRPS